MHAVENAVFCAPDADIPIDELQMFQVPVLTAIDKVRRSDYVIYLEGHRAPPSTLKVLADAKCTAIVHGNPCCLSSSRNEEICAELAKLPEQRPRRVPCTDMHATLPEALEGNNGYTRILCSNKENKAIVMDTLRPNGEIRAGDPFFCWKRGYRGFSSANHKNPQPSTMIKFDCGRSAPLRDLNTALVETPHSWGSGECDTLIILPDVSEFVGHAACCRARYKVSSVGVSPSMYLNPPSSIDV